MDQLLYTIAQCCRMAAIGRTKFYELVASGEIPVRKIGRKTLREPLDLSIRCVAVINFDGRRI